jgi:hypothetical protein
MSAPPSKPISVDHDFVFQQRLNQTSGFIKDFGQAQAIGRGA